jgi:chorismate mutase
MGLEELRRASKRLLLEIIRSAAERRSVALKAAAEKLRLGLPLEDPSVEAELWAAAVEEAGRFGMDERAAGRLTWSLVRDALIAEGALREEPIAQPGASEEDVVRLDLDLWAPLLELRGEGTSSLEEAEARLAEALGAPRGSLVAFPSWREALRVVLSAMADGSGVFVYEPVHPWIVRAIWEAGGRPYRVHREVGDCWRVSAPEASRRGWMVLLEDPDYVTGISHREKELAEVYSAADSAGMPVLHASACTLTSAPLQGSAHAGASVSVGGLGCALGSIDAGPSWAVSRALSERLRRLRDSLGMLPRPTDVSAAASAMASGALEGVRGEIRRRIDILGSLIPSGLLEYCEPSSGPHAFMTGRRPPAWMSGVAVARGSAFGSYADGFRINFMVDEDSLRLGLGRLILSLLPRGQASGARTSPSGARATP